MLRGTFLTGSMTPSWAMFFGQRVIADSPAMENECPNGPESAELSYKIEWVGCIPARTGRATRGIETVASPVLVTEKAVFRAPAAGVGADAKLVGNATGSSSCSGQPPHAAGSSMKGPGTEKGAESFAGSERQSARRCEDESL
jgi:hypothetical protein